MSRQNYKILHDIDLARRLRCSRNYFQETPVLKRLLFLVNPGNSV